MPSEQPKKYTRTGLIAKLAKWHGGHNASDNSWGRLASQVDPYDDEKVAAYFHRSITEDVQKPLLAEIAKLKGMLFDLQNPEPPPEPRLRRLLKLMGDGSEDAKLLLLAMSDSLNRADTEAFYKQAADEIATAANSVTPEPVERLMAAGLGKEAAEVAVGMIHDCISGGRRMGMDEGLKVFATREKRPWREELEKFTGYDDKA